MGDAQSHRQYDRDVKIFERYCNGETQAAIARAVGMSQPAIGEIIRKFRERVPRLKYDEIIEREINLLDRMRAQVLDIAAGIAADPPVAMSNGRMVHTVSGKVAADLSGILDCQRMALAHHERLAKLLGLDKPQRTDVTVNSAQEDAVRAAEAALVRLAGEDA